jgi:hypothetical protein
VSSVQAIQNSPFVVSNIGVNVIHLSCVCCMCVFLGVVAVTSYEAPLVILFMTVWDEFRWMGAEVAMAT